jgi:hypothetical protein
MRQRFATLLAVALSLSLLLLAPRADARVVRFALLVGNNRGAATDVELRHAESETLRVHDVLKDIGGFAPENSVVLRGENADDVRRALISLNDRIRGVSNAEDQALLFFYYSGHADANALHLGGSTFDLRELEQLVRGSAATLRLMVLDACRSGAITRAKGGKVVAPFAITMDEKLTGQGMVLLAATAATEDAQESDERR